jgi:hypothetical protein
MYLDVSGASLTELIKAAYALSVPRGLGFLHAEEGELSDAEASALANFRPTGVSLDYVKGRACKFHVIVRGGKHYTPARWYDHNAEDTERLLKRLGLERIEVDEDAVYPPTVRP